MESIAYAIREMGGRDVVLFVVDYAQVELTPHPDVLPHGEEPAIASLDGSMAGRAFTSQSALAVERDDGWHVWVPVSDRSDRLGVLAMTLSTWDEDVEIRCVELGLAVAPLLITSAQYTDLPHLLRRRHRMDLPAEMQWALLPPLSFSAAGAAVAGLLEPAYEVGGDCFDYAYNDGRLDFAIFDMVGHGLPSAVLASLVVGAYRHGRRAGQDLPELANAIDQATRTHPGHLPFATAILARLDVDGGHLRWMTCGHPQPLLVRRGSVLAPVEVVPGLPLGMGALGSVVGGIAEVDLEPGDGVLLYTDGVVDARTPNGEFFGEDRLRDLLAREHAAGDSPQEVIRRLVRSTIDHTAQAGLHDDASMLYMQWTKQTSQAG
ncbi:MAG: PP2C family protein-serine/threonine phosphatase [Jatrophihabitans sp.]|uniref:PP2C family protein-serine/threonine phosphatase n=1 Tax=Jatrophihabitans sp. TaxID=1932789 RepID=UPI003913A813